MFSEGACWLNVYIRWAKRKDWKMFRAALKVARSENEIPKRSLINKNNKRKWWSRGTSVDLDRFTREGKCRWVVEEDKKITMR